MAAVFAGKQLIEFNKWANDAEQDDNKNVKTALKIIRELTIYALRFCDAEKTAGKIEQIALEHNNG